MEPTFDIRGNLIPYKKIIFTLEEFKESFVDSFDSDSTRFEIFENYLEFIRDFQNEVTSNFTQWIDGSFISNKMNPNDIDFVTLINHEYYASHRELIDSKFRLKGAKETYGVDAYALDIFPEEHKNI